MKMNVEELEKISKILCEHLKELGHNEIEINEDYYWEIDSKELYNPYSEPKKLTLGQLTHDVERVQDILKGEDEPLSIGLVWYAAIIRYIGQKIFV